jgi:hypothetical protein
MVSGMQFTRVGAPPYNSQSDGLFAKGRLIRMPAQPEKQQSSINEIDSRATAIPRNLPPANLPPL